MLLAARGLIRLLGWLPLAWLHGLARLAAGGLFRLPWSRHRIIEDNLALCFPELDPSARSALHRQHLAQLLELVVETGVLWHWSADHLRSRVELIEGADLLTRSSDDDGRGTLFVSAHLGNWELLNLYLSLHCDLATLYRAPARAALDAFITQPRERFGARMVPGDRAALRRLFTQLRSGRSVALAADIQPKRGDGLFVPLFGIEALTMTLVHGLARRTGCRVVLAQLLRRPSGQGWTLSLREAGDWIRDPDPMVALGGINQWLESAIRETPAQYLWIYKRFSKRPPGQPMRYPRFKGLPAPSSSKQPCSDD